MLLVHVRLSSQIRAGVDGVTELYISFPSTRKTSVVAVVSKHILQTIRLSSKYRLIIIFRSTHQMRLGAMIIVMCIGSQTPLITTHTLPEKNSHKYSNIVSDQKTI